MERLGTKALVVSATVMLVMVKAATSLNCMEFPSQSTADRIKSSGGAGLGGVSVMHSGNLAPTAVYTQCFSAKIAYAGWQYNGNGIAFSGDIRGGLKESLPCDDKQLEAMARSGELTPLAPIRALLGNSSMDAQYLRITGATCCDSADFCNALPNPVIVFVGTQAGSASAPCTLLALALAGAATLLLALRNAL
eukprot:CAMPEP_0202867192 /NCGR_PEP_ID=MMETSP1391-20130828/8882_1 /ASSEMBLY_ACC=CAM_ASM_000867 /TAXON_ID=1034604 /ORGANISM="Chlamydomonas leiostraca, Strain SAG 11-49" /LENGTH=192 /DNA_ID=CAMNT_0049547207 /DNA_START=101 /DNA_END=679 /DNA_ORIENTATION=+